MAKTPEELLAELEGLGIRVETVRHPPLATVAESRALRGDLDGGHTKNLFLKDRKGQYFLVTAEEDAEIDLKSLHRRIGASGRLSFGRPEAMEELLGVRPGAVTPFGAVNDTEGRVRVILDAELMRHATINAHPLTNEATSAIAREDLLAFLESTGHRPEILKITGENPI